MSGLHQTDNRDPQFRQTRSAPVGSMVVGLDMLMGVLFHNVLCLYGIRRNSSLGYQHFHIHIVKRIHLIVVLSQWASLLGLFCQHASI